MPQKTIIWLFIMAILMTCSGCVTYFGYDGPYEGRVIDKDTRQPIEGVVIHGTWDRAHPGPGGASHSYYDSKEVLTDKDGKFKIEGVGILIFSNMEEMYVYVLKAGYSQIYGTWEGLKSYDKDVEWEGNKPIIKLRRMTLEERKERVISAPVLVPATKRRLFMLEENRENLEIGSPATSIHRME